MTAVTGDSNTRTALLAAWVSALAVLLWVLALLGSGPLAAPPLGDSGALAEWYATRTPPEVLLSGVRLLALGLGWYLLGVTVLGAIVRILRLRRMVTVTDAVTVPAVRHLLRGALGMGLAAAVITGGSGGHGGALPTAIAAAVDEAASDTDAGVTPSDSTAVWDLPIDGPDRLPRPGAVEDSHADGTAAAATRGPAPAGRGAVDWSDAERHDDEHESRLADDATHTIQPGEHLWAVAAGALAERTGGTPREADIAAYWLDVIERNRDRLPDPEDPDLVHPGATIVLPPPPS